MSGSLSTAARMVITIVLVAVLAVLALTVWRSTSAASNNAMGKMNSQLAALDESEYTQYDGAEIDGMRLYSLLQSNASKAKSSGIDIEVLGKTYSAGDADALSAAREKGKDTYIAPSATFTGKLERNKKTNEITKLTFTLVDKTS